jgi:predicted acyltransferase (DUF342 family)
MSTNAVFELHPGITMKGQLSMTKDIVLTGKFEGDLQTQGRLTVAAGGIVTGSIEAGSLILEPGNQVEAKIKVGSQPRKKAAEETRRASGDNNWSGRLKKLKEIALGRK